MCFVTVIFFYCIACIKKKRRGLHAAFMGFAKKYEITRVLLVTYHFFCFFSLSLSSFVDTWKYIYTQGVLFQFFFLEFSSYFYLNIYFIIIKIIVVIISILDKTDVSCITDVHQFIKHYLNKYLKKGNLIIISYGGFSSHQFQFLAYFFLSFFLCLF